MLVATLQHAVHPPIDWPGSAGNLTNDRRPAYHHDFAMAALHGKALYDALYAVGYQ